MINNKGVRNPNHKLTEEQVIVIRYSSLSQRTLARLFHIGQPEICRIKNCKLWNYNYLKVNIKNVNA